MYQAQLIKAAEGDDVTLQCRLDPPVSLSAFTVDWTRLENKDIVHVYRHQQDDPDPQTDQYRGRTTLLHEDLIRGVLTLHISSVKLSDRGLYKGFVPKLKTSCVVDLIVGEHAEFNTVQVHLIQSVYNVVPKLDLSH